MPFFKDFVAGINSKFLWMSAEGWFLNLKRI